MRNILVTLLLSVTFPCFSQVAFQTIPYTDALKLAQAEGKMIFLQLESPECKQCTEVAEKGLSDSKVSDRINQAFIPLYISAKHKDRKEIEFLFNTPDGFGTLFIDQSGTLLHKFPGTTSFSKDYLDHIDKAFLKAGESLKISELEREYRNGNQSFGFLEQLLIKKRELNLDYTALLDEYASRLPADSLSSVYTLQFIASMAPILGSRADYTLRNKVDLFNLAWYQMPLNKRVSINSRIIYLSLRKAVQEKDERFALRIANFARGTVTSNKTAADRAYQLRMMEFYEMVDNDPSYLAAAVKFYDTYYMPLSSDSVKQVDEVTRERLFKEAKKDTIRTEKGYTLQSKIGYVTLANRMTGELKAGAWNVYKRTSDPILLAKASAWVQKGLTFSETYDALEVYALLLYKQQRIDEAIKAEKKAISLKKKMGYTTKDNEATLTRMEQGLPPEG
jgi:hypothetical protein